MEKSLATLLNSALPGNLRYQPADLKEHFGYDQLVRPVVEVELATLHVLGDVGIIPQAEIDLLTPMIVEKVMQIPTTQVDRTERLTKHDIRALVIEIQKIVGEAVGRWVHVPLTSYDALDTGRTLQYARSYHQVFKRNLRKVAYLLAGMVEEHANTLQIGRTHGQHALPITAGFWLATVLSRILYNWEKMEETADQLVGKISGAVGAYNAQIGLGISSRCGDYSFESRVLDKLGLRPSRISTQILPPEPLAYFLYACYMQSAALAQFGRDCRHLMRTEIGEVAESFVVGQTGSSTMAHKRNPINFENLEGMYWKNTGELVKVLVTLVSEHQRDLVASSVARDFPIILVNLLQQLVTLLRKDDKQRLPFLVRVRINNIACRSNFAHSAHLILAEPLYIALQMAGYQKDAHKLVNRVLVPKAQETGRMLIDVLDDLALEGSLEREALSQIPEDIIRLLHRPQEYTGLASQQAWEIAALARKQVALSLQ